MPPVTMDRRLVEVIADRGPSAHDRYRHGSGILLGGRTVLTAAHVVRDADALLVRGPDKCEIRVDPGTALVGDGVRCDLALLAVPEAAGLPHPPLALITRQVVGGDVVEGCWSVGYPEFQEIAGSDGSTVRESAQVRGHILPLAGLVGGLLSLQIAHSPRPLPDKDVALGRSEWAGMSGAPVFAGDRLIGVVAEHAPRRGSSDISVEPLSRLLDPDAAPPDAAAWWDRLGVPDPAALPVLPRPVPAACLRPRRGLPDRPAPSMLLRGEFRLVPFDGRADELRRLLAWCRQDEALSVLLLTAPGGQGKTRLADELCDRLGADWTAGFADPAAAPDELSRLARGAGRCLLIVDYAETRSEHVRELIKVFARERAATLRLLLLARSAGDWWTRLHDQADEETAAVLELADHEQLKPLPTDPADRHASFEAARDAFARELGADPRNAPAPPDLADPRYGLTLTLHMAALVLLLDAADPLAAPKSRDPAARVLAHERRYWQRTAPGIDEEILGQVVMAATVCGAADRAEAYRLLPRLPDLGDQKRIVLTKCLSWMAQVLPGEAALNALQPDLLGEDHTANVLNRAPELAGVLAAGADDAQLHQLLTVLGRAAARHQHVTDLLPSLLAGEPERRVPAAVEVATQLTDPAPLAAAAEANLAAVHSRDTLIRIVECVPAQTVAMADLALNATRTLVEELGPAADSPRFAWPLQDLATRYSIVGDHDKALALGKRAVATLGGDSRSTNSESLAAARNTVATALLSLGRPGEAVPFLEPNVTFWEQRHKAEPGRHHKELAEALGNLSAAHIARHDARAAARTCDRLTALCRLPPDGGPDTQASHAVVLVNLGQMHAALGRESQAVAAVHKAEEILRPLAAWRPDTYGPAFANALNSHAATLARYHRPGRAIGRAEEAVRTLQSLADLHSVRYLPDLAQARQTLAGLLGQLDRHAEAFEQIGAAMQEICRLLEHGEQRHVALAPRAIGNLSFLAIPGDRVEEALRYLDAIEDWCRRHESGASDLLLGRVLTERCRLFRHGGRSKDAAACGDEAVVVLGRTDAPRLAIARAYAALAAARAGNGELDHACAAAFRAIKEAGNADPAEDVDVLNVTGLLGNLAKALLTAKRTPDAEWIARRIVEMLRGPATRNPAKREDLARALFNHGVCLKGLGQLEWLFSVQQAIQLLRDQQASGFGTSQTREELDFYVRFRDQAAPLNVAAPQSGTTVERIQRPGRNDPCPCGSGQKYKRCCGRPRANRP